MAELRVASLAELPPGSMRLVEREPFRIGVYNCDGALHAIEDRCSHDDGPLCLGNWDAEDCTVVCPRHGANFDIRTGDALTLPAFQPVSTYAVHVVDGQVRLELP